MKITLNSGEIAFVSTFHIQKSDDKSIQEQIDEIPHIQGFTSRRKGINAITITKLEIPGRGLSIIAHADCAKDDQFVRRAGVRVSVTRAVEGLPKEDRISIWNKVWNLDRTKRK